MCKSRGTHRGTAAYDPVTVTWTLTFVDGALWWDTPPAPGGGPYWFTLVEGSTHGLSMTARINGPRAGPVAVKSITGLTITPSFIPAGQTSVQCMITVPPNPQFANTTLVVQTGHPSPLGIQLFLANRNNVPLNVFAPARVIAGASTRVDVSCPGVTASTLLGPPPDLGQRNVTVAALDFDNSSVPIPVTLDSSTSGIGPYPTKYLRVTFPPMNRRVRLTVTTDDGITGQSGPIQIGDTQAAGDGIDALVAAALQRPASQLHEPPLAFERDGTAFHVVLASRPLDLKGWTVVIEWSADVQTWTPAPGGSTTVTPNPDGTTERVSVLLPTDAARHFVRLRVRAP